MDTSISVVVEDRHTLATSTTPLTLAPAPAPLLLSYGGSIEISPFNVSVTLLAAPGKAITRSMGKYACPFEMGRFKKLSPVRNGGGGGALDLASTAAAAAAVLVLVLVVLVVVVTALVVGMTPAVGLLSSTAVKVSPSPPPVSGMGTRCTTSSVICEHSKDVVCLVSVAELSILMSGHG